MKKYDTRQRDYLINFLDQHPDQLLSVRQIAQELCSQQISLSAVYRNLSQLEAEGLIRKSIKPGSREAYYQYVGAEDCHSHLHLSCTRCGKTFHMDASIVRDDADQIMAMTNSSPALDRTTAVIGTTLISTITGGGNYASATALGIVQGLVGLVLVLVMNSIVKKTECEGLL